MYRSWVEINKKVLQHNIEQFQKLIGDKIELVAIVKANAYGHGLVEIAKIAVSSRVNWLGVDSIDEALKLRKAGIDAPILILGYTLLSKLKEVIKYDLRQVVYNKETIVELAKQATKQKKKIKIHLKVETGTLRQGLKKEELLELARFIKKHSQIQIEGIYTHYANIEDTTDYDFAQLQLKRFKQAVDLLEKNDIKVPIKHTACSAAIILFPETYFNMVRLGISMYGLWPSKETFVSAQEKNQRINLEPILTWKTRIAQIKNIKAGDPVGYGLTERVSRDSKIAVLPVGYWDGYDRKLSGVGNVLIKGKRCKLLGRVCMNMVVVDVTDVIDAKLEDEVIILGKRGKEEITVEEIAQKIGTINYEVVTRINPLIPRIIVDYETL
jgi:alanine racemase